MYLLTWQLQTKGLKLKEPLLFQCQDSMLPINSRREKCKKMDVSISEVFNTIQTYLGSTYVNDFTIYNREFHVIVQADTLYRNDIMVLNKYYVRNSQGTMLPLSAVLSYKVNENASLLTHYNLYRMAEFVGDSKPGYSSGQALLALQETANQILPKGYGYEFSGLSREGVAGQVILQCIFLYFQYYLSSYSCLHCMKVGQCLSQYLLGVPLAAFGAILALWL